MTAGRVRWLWLALFPMLSWTAWLVQEVQGIFHLEGCGKKRVMYNESWGIVTDGDGDYPQNSHCEWLIAATKPGQYINLKFHEMLTECSYDYLFVYDGDSYNSAILGSFSGETLPSAIYARSGKMLILLFSDTNYVQKGFVAEYSATDCPLNCSYHGRCDNNVCICDNMWAGENCSIHLCPENCWQTEGQGICERIPEPARCVCKPGFSGQACSLGVNDTIGNRWHTLATAGTGFVARTGHAGIYLPLFDSLYIFGGFTLNDVLGDLVVYSFSSSQWKTLQPNGNVPSSRYGHAMAAYGEYLALYGGRLRNNSFCKDLWLYDVANNTWSLQKVGGAYHPPGLARHSLTLVDDYYLYLFGGNHEDGLFSSAMYRINLKEYPRPRWERIFTHGGKELERRLVGHSAVFHTGSRSLIVYGGIAVDVAKFSKLSEKIHIFNVDSKYWSFVNYSKRYSDFHVPMERAFHSANLVGNYMVVYGGYTHQHSKEEICYDQKMYFYHLGCHVWVSTEGFSTDFPGNQKPSSQGSFSHVSAIRNGNTLLLAGGYSGAVRGDLLAYTVPASIAMQTSLEVNMSAICKRHRTRESCKANPECGWCPGPLGTSNDTCMDRLQTVQCKLKLDTSNCLGICPLLPDCQACLAIGGQSHTLGKPGDYPKLWKPCVWCVQKAECYAQGHPVGICAAGLNTSIDVVGWWGFNATNIVSLDECRYKDFRPGLTLLKYRHPPNWKQPDEVSIINSTTENFSFMPQFPGHREQEARGEYIARFRGFIHPLGTKPKAEQHLRLFIGTSLVKAVLRMSLNESEQFLEVVANHTSGGNLQRTEAHRPGDKSLFPDPSRGHKYLIDFDVRLTIHSDTSFGEQATIQLVWNGFPNFRKEFTFEFLEPYNGGVCISYNNCLACIADAACGWCPMLSQCMERIPDGAGNGACANHEQTQYLVTQSRDCIICADYIYCENCTQQSHCEWLIEDSHCVRRGRFDDAIRSIDSCPIPCHLRINCSSCLGDPGRCAWCEHMQQCFLFSTYTSSYLYGMCREWVDEDHMTALRPGLSAGAQCRNCSQHATCKECLTDLRCGWCGSQGNPIIGLCVDGDFHGPSSGKCPRGVGHKAKKEDYMWSYGICPDVEECLLGLHDCHANATCTNTFDSYTCTCNRGFRGNGRDSCIKTCLEKCVHGICSESPLYQCNCKLGWTGSDCSVNCGCHNHSSCLQNIGQCDECQDWTEGAFCERCKPGSFGNATTDAGCQKCNCNEHGNMSEGYCDMVTGICFCQDHTEGDRCDRCLNGYYGDPRNGGHCYLQCGSRQLLTSVEKGGLGSHPSGTSGDSCLWILTVHPELRQESLFLRESSTPSIQLTMHAGMNVACSENYVYVYDGLPNFVSHDVHWDWQNKVLSAFCGSNLNQSAVVEAKSGFLTVFYQRGDPRQGFNTTFVVHTCSGKCPPNRTCSQGWCQCQKGFAGPDCTLRVCPEDCSEPQKKGICIEEYGVCSCSQGFGGSDCSHKLSPAQPALTTLFDPALLAPSAEHLANALPRMGHSLVADHQGNLWMFGGYSLSRGSLNDMFEFDTLLHKWQQVHPQSGDFTPPKGRYFHAAALLKRRHEIYIYGGLSRNEVLRDFWKFDIRSRQWTPLDLSFELTPLAGHTLTACGDDKLVLIGGFDTHQGFLGKSFEYDVITGQWSALNVTGGVPSGLYGHTTVYHPQTFSFYVFGGIVYKVDKTVISNDLYAFHYPTRRWTVLPAEKGPFSLSGHRFRYMHSAVTLEDYMVVVGGRSKSGELARSVLVYSYACNMWVDLATQGRRIFGGNPEPTIGLAMAQRGHSIYLFGGVTGKLMGTLTRLDVPSDLCSLFTAQQNCWQALGCLYCSVHHNNRTNQSFCYSTKLSIPPRSGVQNCNIALALRSLRAIPPIHTYPMPYFGQAQRVMDCQPAVTVTGRRVDGDALDCSNPDGTVELSTTTRQCNKELVENRDCSYSASCSECLAVWPSYPNAKNACQWCTTCQGSRCIPSNRSCEEESNCNYLKQVIRDPHNCPERVCAASDCEKCRDIKQCIWTRNILRSSDKGRTVSSVNHKPIYDWSCSHRKFQMASNVEVVSMPPLACPPRCVQHKDCRSCLESAGAEGGWHECHWSEALNECLSPSYQPLRCAGGICGLVLRGSSERCARKCFEFTQCSHCLAQPHCGWCAFTGNSVDGRGICMEGGLDRPTGGVCSANNVSIAREPLPANVSDWLSLAVSPPLWAYMKCPPENECLNHHHTCDKKSEECIDMAEGFRCQCRKGYVNEGKICKPVCRQGCVYGTCVAPDVCDCHFGYVGNNCSTQCQCNGHSDCAGLDQLDICIKCHNDTQGRQCDKCQKFFVGNPFNNGKCVSCHIYCNGHTAVCVGAEYFNVTLQMLSNDLDYSNQLSEKLDVPEEGATTEAACILCQNHTRGERCELCHPGYFRTTDNAQEPCRPCECHGHGNSCDAHTGEKCNCQNNTETDQQCSQKGKNSTPCWMAQCSKCKESFLGTPINGQQCYRQMFVDRDYCFDPVTQDSCLTPNPLLWGRTVYFAVHPKYMNVDIRVVLDVAQGGVDLYFSPKEDTFVVSLNQHNGMHLVSVNSQYGIDFQNNAVDMPLDSATSFDEVIRTRRGTQDFRHNRDDDLINIDVKRPQFRVIEKAANGLSTFVTITNPFDILVVRNIQNRLVITLPQEVHALIRAKFYMVLHGGDSSHSNVTYGSLFFRQDQPRIDLFVFFSVFFSCFFLFLAVCVVIWKVKQAVDIQRARQRQAVEMEHMASRPFARVTVIIDENLAEYDFLPYSPALYSKKSKGGKHLHGRDSPKISNDDKYLVRPVALEPTDDGVAAVGTVMMQLPGSNSAPVKLTLGSALVTTRLYPNTYSSIKACMRRRTSYHST